MGNPRWDLLQLNLILRMRWLRNRASVERPSDDAFHTDKSEELAVAILALATTCQPPEAKGACGED